MTDEEFPGQHFVGRLKPTVEVLEAFWGLLLGLCRTGTVTDESKASVPGWPIVVVSRNPAYRVAQYDEAQEAHPAKGRFQKVASIAEDLALKARLNPD